MIIGLLTTIVFLKDEYRQGDFYSILQVGQWEPVVDLILLYIVCNSISESSLGNTL